MQQQNCPFNPGKICLNPKTIHCTELSKDKTNSFDMCADCGTEFIEKHYPQQQQKQELPLIKSPMDLLAYIFNAPPIAQSAANVPNVEEEYKNHKCENCGISFLEVLKIGKIGCEQCYKTFVEKTSLSKIIQRAQDGAIKHVGKSPKNINKYKNAAKIEELKIKMMEAAKEEKYEEAAKIKNIIKELGGQND